MTFDNVRLLSFAQNNRTFGNGSRFGKEIAVTIQGTFLDEDAQDSVEGIWTKSQLLLAESVDWDDIIISGYDIGKGKITNISFPEGDDLQRKEYVVSLFVLQEGNLDDIAAGIHLGLTYLETETAPIHLFEEIEANISISNTDEVVSYSRSISFRIHEADDLAISFHERAKFFAQKFFAETFAVGFINGQTDGVLAKAGTRFSNESYNSITGDVAFDQSFEFRYGEESATNLITHTFSQDASGTITVSESGEITAIEKSPEEYGEEDESLDRTAVDEIDEALAGAFNRCNAVFNSYVKDGEYGDHYPLNSQRLSLEKVVNGFTGTAEYSISFTNNPSHENAGYSHDFTIQIQRNDGNITEVTESGEIVGLANTLTERNTNADNALNSEKALIKARVVSRSGIADENLFIVNRTISSNRFQGRITYGYSFTDDKSRVNEEDIKIVEVDVTDNKPVHLFNQFGIINVKEIIQSAASSTIGTRQLSCEVVGYRDSSLTSLTERAKTEANSFIPAGSDTFLSSCQFSYDKQARSINLNVEWKFFESVAENKELLS